MDSKTNPAHWKGGYDTLALGMATCDSFAVFRRFRSLSLENLLYLQADLVRLEKRLRKIQEEDRVSGHEHRAKYSLAWQLIVDSKQRSEKPDDNGNNARQLNTILEIRRCLREYRGSPRRLETAMSSTSSLTKCVLLVGRGSLDSLPSDATIPTTASESRAGRMGMDEVSVQGKHRPLRA